MSNAAKAKGSAFERLVCNYIGELMPCERIPAGAELDRGDLWTPHAAIQTKNRKELRIASWLDETVAQQHNAAKQYHWLVVKRRGTTDPAAQLAVCTADQMRALMRITLP